jgi:UDP-glucuronate decarboxylase
MIVLARAVMQVTGREVELVRRPLPADDPRRRCPDITRARAAIGFEPAVPLAEGLQRTHDNFVERMRYSMRPPAGP